MTQDLNLIQGKCFLNNQTLIAPFDAKATHSFISLNCTNQLGLSMSSLPYDLIVSTPTRGRMLTSCVCQDYPIQINYHHFIIYLVCITMHKIDITLSMN